jgi:hypothetical protein
MKKGVDADDGDETDSEEKNRQKELAQQKLKNANDISKIVPLMFAPQGSKLLEGQDHVFKLEQKWNYPQGSDELQLHRQILGQAAVAARTLESMCAIEAWRDYLDAFIKEMEKRKDTMLYNWI